MIIDSLKKRYIYKVLTNLFGFAISFVTAGIVPKSLGVESYGIYNYVNNIYSQIYGLLDFKTSTCLYVNLSKEKSPHKLINFYIRFIATIVLIVFSFTFAVVVSPLLKKIFPETLPNIVVLAFIFCTISWVIDIFSLIFDALGLTVYFEKIRFVNRIISTTAIILSSYLKLLNIHSLYFISIATLLFLLIAVLIQQKKQIVTCHNNKLTKNDKQKYFKLFLTYSSPLAIYTILQFFGNIFDRWFLQIYGGSFQQGIFSFSYTLMSFSSVFINSFQPLITREFSISLHSNDIKQIKKNYLKFNLMLFLLLSYFSFYVSMNSSTIVHIFGGKAYDASIITLQILIFYPLLSSYSLLNSAIIYSSGKTDIFLKLTYFLLPLGIGINFVLIDPRFGIAMGATGLAIKNVLVNLISTSIIAKIIAKKMNIPIIAMIKPIFYILPFILSGYLSSLIKVDNSYALLFASGFIYSVIVGIIFYVLYRTDILDIEIKNQITILYDKMLSRFKL